MDNGCQQHRPEISTYWLSLDNEKNMSCSHIPTVHAVILSVPAWSCISELLRAPRVLREPQSQHCQSRSLGCVLTWKEDTLVHEHWGLQTYRGKKGGGHISPAAHRLESTYILIFSIQMEQCHGGVQFHFPQTLSKVRLSLIPTFSLF